MKEIDLTPFKNELTHEELQQFDLGEIVSTPDGVGIIAAFVEEPFEYPAGSANRVERIENERERQDVTMQEIDASEERPVYIVALQKGGSVAVTAEEIDSNAALEDDDGKDIESFEDVEGDVDEAEMSAVYEYCDGDPHDPAVLEDAKREYIHETYASELAEYVNNSSASLATLEEMDSEELVNVRGIDDPHIGLNRLPPGWTRKSVLQAYVSLGASWRTCYARIIRVKGPNFAKRFCSALKDSVLRTEKWRSDF